jgi:anthranilate phosphoribosyltransferase
MPSKTPSEVLAALVTQRYPVPVEVWGDFWDRLSEKTLHPGEALAVLASLTTRMPDGVSVGTLLQSLRERNPEPAPPGRPTVNIVGTGGGPSTFNLSTASAFVAASMGARVIKTGSRAYASRTGSVDLLDRLGVRQTSSYEQIDEMLDQFGMACAGPFVYPRELRLLARQILPFDMKTVGRFFNLIGPFLGAVPVTTQITGVSDHSVLPTFRGLVDEEDRKRVWVTWNELGVDELLSVTDSHVYDSGKREEFLLKPKELGLGNGTFDDLLPVSDLEQTVPHFIRLIGGDGPPGAIESIRLNAAALAVNAEVAADWEQGLAMAAEAMERGAPAKLIEQLKAHGEQAAAAKAAEAATAKAQAG